MMHPLLLCLALLVPLNALDLTTDPDVADARSALAAADQRLADMMVGKLLALDWTPLPEVTLGADPRQSEVDRASAIRNYNDVARRVDMLARRYTDHKNRADTRWVERLIEESHRWMQVRAAVLPPASAPVPAIASPRPKARAILADGTVVEE